MSSAASANSHFRNIVILGRVEVAFGQTIQYRLAHRRRRAPMYQALRWPSRAYAERREIRKLVVALEAEG